MLRHMGTTTSQSHPEPLAALLALSGPTAGWFLSGPAHAAGVRPAQLGRLRRAGVIESPSRGVNRITAYPDTWDGRAIGALWTAGPRSALARHAALRILRQGDGSPAIDVIVPRGVQPRSPTIAVRASSRLRPEDVLERGHWRFTSPAFTVCDLAAVATSAQLLRIAGALQAEDHLDLEDLHGMVARFAWIEGVARARRLLAELDPSARWTRSDGERAFPRIVRSAELPRPVANLRVTDADGRRRYFDFAYPELRIGIELDLHPTHRTTLGRREDGARQNALVLEGWTVLRFDLADLLLRPDVVARTIAAAIERATRPTT